MTISFQESVSKSREQFLRKLSLDELCVDFVSEEEFRKELDIHFKEIFSLSANNYIAPEEEKQRVKLLLENYKNIHHDRLIIRDKEGNFIGHFMGESEDQVTYYLRNAGIIPSYRKKHIATKFMTSFLDYLYELGYARVSSQHHGNNNAVLILMLKNGFSIAGLEVREEWGSLIKLVKHLNSDRAQLFDKVIKGGRAT